MEAICNRTEGGADCHKDSTRMLESVECSVVGTQANKTLHLMIELSLHSLFFILKDIYVKVGWYVLHFELVNDSIHTVQSDLCVKLCSDLVYL